MQAIILTAFAQHCNPYAIWVVHIALVSSFFFLKTSMCG